MDFEGQRSGGKITEGKWESFTRVEDEKSLEELRSPGLKFTLTPYRCKKERGTCLNEEIVVSD